MQADLCSERVKRALKVAKSRGKKLGTRNPKVAGKGAAKRKSQLEAQAMQMLPKIAKLHRLGYGGRLVQQHLNQGAAALRLNKNKPFHLSKVQRLVNVLVKKKKIR